MSVMSDLRVEALERAGHRCEWPDCNEYRWLETSHVIPRGSGGTDTTGNLWILCKTHHDIYDGRQPQGRLHAVRQLAVGFLTMERKEERT